MRWAKDHSVFPTELFALLGLLSVCGCGRTDLWAGDSEVVAASSAVGGVGTHSTSELPSFGGQRTGGAASTGGQQTGGTASTGSLSNGGTSSGGTSTAGSGGTAGVSEWYV